MTKSLEMNHVFLDTSIAIARVVHSPEIKKSIAARLTKFEASAISLVVRQEFKRRLLKEAQYLLRQLNEKKSYTKVLRHVVDQLGPFHERKRNICLETLTLVHEKDSQPLSDAELTERAKRTLRSLIRSGLKDLSNSVSYEITTSQCSCAQYPIVEKVKYKSYEFGPDECAKTGESCGIVKFLASHELELRNIYDHLNSLQTKTAELERIQRFIELVLSDYEKALKGNPCLEVGDLIIALESIGTKTFYTLNRKESLHLARVLKQDLIIRPKNPERDDEVFQLDNSWPESESRE